MVDIDAYMRAHIQISGTEAGLDSSENHTAEFFSLAFSRQMSRLVLRSMPLLLSLALLRLMTGKALYYKRRIIVAIRRAIFFILEWRSMRYLVFGSMPCVLEL